jgi:hypothetical protein
MAAHLMDPERKELYVEGPRDYLFLTWLLAGRMNPDATVREIAGVDLPDQLAGGRKGRLIHFANLLSDRHPRIRMFADADWDRILNRPVPGRVWLTDHRDMEGYILREECFDKVLRLGVGTEQISGGRLLELVRNHGRRLGMVRLMSELDSMGLPFQATSLKKHLKVRDPIFLDLDGYLRALLQNAKVKLTHLAETKARLGEVELAYSSAADSEIIHGKDAASIVEAVLSRFGLRAEEGRRLLWTSFELAFVENGSTLDAVARFLREA